MIQLENGTRMYPKLQAPPQVPVGYKATNDPYVMKPIIPKCDRRMVIMKHDTKCKCQVPVAFCDKKKQINPYPDCFNCKKVLIEEKLDEIEECTADGIITEVEEELVDELMEEIDELFAEL